MTLNPIVSGRGAFAATALQLLEATEPQVREVASFRTQVRDYSAPRMEQASSIPAPTLAERGRLIDTTA